MLYGPLLALRASNSPSQLHVFGHNRDSLPMNGTVIGILEQTNKMCLRGFL